MVVITDCPGQVRLPSLPVAPCSRQLFSQSAARQKKVGGEGKENFMIQSSGASKSCKLAFRVILLFFHLFHQEQGKQHFECSTNE